MGANGSGKSTLVKLIMELYIPTDGGVFYGRIDTKNADPKALLEKNSAVFQNYGRCKLTLEDNVIMSDFDMQDVDKKESIRDLRGGDIQLYERSLPQGENTLLSKDFSGMDISGRQWKRVAIARGLCRKPDLIVLDELTAAIDPVEETCVYDMRV